MANPIMRNNYSITSFSFRKGAKKTFHFIELNLRKLKFMYKQVVEAKGTEITIQLPQELADKKVEVVIHEWKDTSYRDDMSFEEAKAHFQNLAVDLSQYKFDREEANGF